MNDIGKLPAGNKPSAGAKRVIPFKVDIVFLFCLIIIPTVIAVTTYTYKKNSAAALEMSNQLVEKITLAVIEKTMTYLEPAKVISEITSRLLSLPAMDIAPGSPLENYFMEILLSQPQVDFVYYGDEAGNFIDAVWLNEKDPITIKYIHHESGLPMMTYRYFNPGMDLIKERQATEVLMDPRTRPWYCLSKKAMATIWTDPYIFASTGKPGLTAAAPVIDQEGQFAGVVAADITLAELSDFLRDLKVSDNGLVFIMNHKRQMIAFPDPDRMVKVKDGKMVPIQVVDLNEKWITHAIRRYEDTSKSSFTYRSGKENILAFFTPFPPDFGKDWVIVSLVPEDDFLGPIKRTHKNTLIMSCVILVVAVLFGLILAKTLSRPIERLTQEVLAIKNFDLKGSVDTTSYIYEIQMMANAVQSMKVGLQAFRRYVPAELVRKLIESGEDAVPGGREREMTIFFSDIAGFTTITEQIPARELMVNLSEYLNAVTRVISDERGTVDKYIGDAVMAFWGAPLPSEDHAVQACRAALSCREAIKEMNSRWEKSARASFKTRMGLHTGFTIVGNMGSDERLNYTVLGDNVNLASRLEGANKLYGTEILVSQATYRYVRNDFILRPIDIVAVKGKTTGVKIFELMGHSGLAATDELRSLADASTSVFELYLKREWKDALERLESIKDSYPNDRPTQIYTERCKNYLRQGPGEEWSGVIRLDTK